MTWADFLVENAYDAWYAELRRHALKDPVVLPCIKQLPKPLPKGVLAWPKNYVPGAVP